MNGPEIYAFVSVKGGVGKTTLAAAAAAGFAAEGRTVAIVDLDFMGTSFADAFALRSPDLWEGGALRRFGPPGPLLSRAETLERRRDLWDPELPVRLPFLNDVIFRRPTKFSSEVIAWRDDTTDIRWFPTSPGLPHAREAARWILVEGEGRFARGLVRVLKALFRLVGDGVVVLDLPPGLSGVVTLLDDVVKRQIGAYVRYVYALVSTEDRNDLFRSVDDFRSLWLEQGVPARWILNRHTRDLASSQRRLRDFLGPVLRAGRIEQQLRGMPYDPEGLGNLVNQDRFGVAPETSRRLVRILREGM